MQVTVKYDLTSDRVSSIFTSAFEGGMTRQ